MSTSTPAPPLPHNWCGTLTTNNVEQVADLMRKYLAGKVYTFVASNELRQWRPDVRTSQRLESDRPGQDPIQVIRHTNKHVQIIVSDTYGVWGLSSTAKSAAHDPDFHTPYLSFERGQVSISQRAGAGNLLHWVVAPARHS